MIILILLSQYFHNKSYMASCNWFLFELTINITFYLPLTTCHIHFIIKFLWKYCVLIFIKNNVLGFCPFVPKKKKIDLQDSGLLYCWQQNEAIFSYTFCLHKQKITLLLQPTNIYLHMWFFLILLISLSLFYIFLVFLFSWSNILINTL